ncbi:MAG: protein-S-isoprenylcysteine O-methyltransferase [Chloroflexota bacterium]
MKRLSSAVYFGGMVAEAIVRAPHARQRVGIAKVDRRVSPAERGIVAGLFLGMGLLPLVYTFSGRLDGADYRLSRGARAGVGGIGAALLGAAVWLFWRSHRDLGTNWSPSLEIGERQTLVTRGVYGVIRHPMYASQLLWGLGQALLLPNWLAGLGGLAMFVALYLARVPAEERMMLDHFGDAYRAYAARTGGIVPRL